MHFFMLKGLYISSLIFVLTASMALGAAVKDRKDRSDNPGLKQKAIEAIKITEPPVIDGVLDDEIWHMADLADNFIQYSPFNGSPSKFRTEVRVLYDNSAIYIGAMMYDTRPDSIYTELGERDSDYGLNADQFTIDISRYNGGIICPTFKVSS